MNCSKLLVVTGALLAWVSSGHAAVVAVGSWALGEASSTNGGGAQADPYVKLVDSISGNHITVMQDYGNTPYLVTTGLAAPGSTAALAKDAGAAGNSGWYGWDAPFNRNDDWAFELWVRPDTDTGGVLAQTDNTNDGLSIFARSVGDGQNLVFGHGTNSGTSNPTAGIPYTVGAWYRANIIRYDGTNYFYLNGLLQDSETSVPGLLSGPLLGFGTSGWEGTYGAFDEMRAWTFDHTGDSLQDVMTAINVAVPEPGGFLLALIGTLAVWRRRGSRFRRV